MLVIHLLRQFSPVCFTLTAYDNLSVIRQKGESQNGGSKKARQIFRKNERFLHPDTHRSVFISGGKKCLFFGKFGELCFLVTPFNHFAFFIDEFCSSGWEYFIWNERISLYCNYVNPSKRN